MTTVVLMFEFSLVFPTLEFPLLVSLQGNSLIYFLSANNLIGISMQTQIAATIAVDITWLLI